MMARQQPMLVYQDEALENQPPMIGHIATMTKPNRRPLGAASANTVLNAPSRFPTKQSPSKMTSKPSSSPNRPSSSNRLNMVPMLPPTSQPLPTDSIPKKQPPMSRFKTVTQKPMSERAPQTLAEATQNPAPILFPMPPNLSFENYYQQKPNSKRTLLDAAPIKEARPAKKPRLEDAPLPAPDSFPAIVDDGTKPAHSYATLIGMAILRAPNRRLTLSQIYKWISDTYSFYHPQDAGWQNSIRHNLSLNKHFVKQERPKDDPGKGNYWAIEAGAEHMFIKEKPGRRSASQSENLLPVMTTRLEPSQPLATIQEPIQPPQLPGSQPMLPALPQPSSSQIAQQSFAVDVSSDATIPVSDAPGPEESIEQTAESNQPADMTSYSPLAVTMHSSPPIPRHLSVQLSGTPPPVHGLPAYTGSRSRSHKRKFASMDDSGYISSLESSIMRPRRTIGQLTSELERPRIKRGRAEEEIARLRSSSYDSPSKGRCYNGMAPPSSSPLRQQVNESTQMLPPLTPLVRFKKPMRPPPSVSPNTNLRMHREKVKHMLESPIQRMPAISETSLSWSPAVKFDDFVFNVNDISVDFAGDTLGFDIFQDGAVGTASPFVSTSVLESGSPAKRSTKRARFDRSLSTSALSEVTNSASLNSKSITSAPQLKPAAAVSYNFLDTPSKYVDGLPTPNLKLFPSGGASPSKLSTSASTVFDENTAPAPWISLDDLCAPEMLGDLDELAGIDILGGFEKIGASTATQPVNARQGYGKPPLGRSHTSIF
jgi:forkhead transcription factor HCM1